MDKELLKKFIEELGEAIRDAVSTDEKIAMVIEKVKNAGYDLCLVLECTMGLQKHESETGTHHQKPSQPGTSKPTFTANDTKFMKSMRISLDEDNDGTSPKKT